LPVLLGIFGARFSQSANDLQLLISALLLLKICLARSLRFAARSFFIGSLVRLSFAHLGGRFSLVYRKSVLWLFYTFVLAGQLFLEFLCFLLSPCLSVTLTFFPDFFLKA
jgi:hypothetical protein